MRRILIPTFLIILCLPVRGQTNADSLAHQPDSWSLHFQLTSVTQFHSGFPAHYSGLNSLSPTPETKSSLTATVFAGCELWTGGEIFLNPELVAGEGLSKTLGVAGFPNGEIFRVGEPGAKLSLSRIFLRSTFGFGGGGVFMQSGENQLSGILDARYLRFTVGKFSVVDIVDDNKFSHDARSQFLNWSVMDNGAWDYPADTRGYTWGAAIEYVDPQWAIRFYLTMVPYEANGMRMDPLVARANGEAVEVEFKFSFLDRPSVARIGGYVNNARMGTYRDALAQKSPDIDITQSRHYGASKYGLCLSADQEISENAGVFLRLGWNDGRTETWAFTEIDRTICLGSLLNGKLWGRPEDSFGIVGVVNGLSSDHRDYLAAGGYGFIIGDGRLAYAPELIAEIFYRRAVYGPIFLTADYQFISNPAYNRDRGPVSVFSARVHIVI